eukprot:2284012-Prymnesium_polylepis.1
MSQKAQKASTLPRHLCPIGATARRCDGTKPSARRQKRPLDAPRHSSGHGEDPNSSIRPPSHA